MLLKRVSMLVTDEDTTVLSVPMRVSRLKVLELLPAATADSDALTRVSRLEMPDDRVLVVDSTAEILTSFAETRVSRLVVVATIDVDRLPMLLNAVVSPVESETTLLLVALRPVEVDVDSEATLLLVVLRPVDVEVESAPTLLLVVLRPVEADVDSEATLLLVVLRPVEVDVDSKVRLLLVVLRPVDSSTTLLTVELSPVDRLPM
jgi:hypothetical protein